MSRWNRNRTRPWTAIRSKRSLLLGLGLVGLGLMTPAWAIDHQRGAGEPYKLLGKRMVFSSWYWIRPGQYDWQDRMGKSGFADDDVKGGPFESHFVSIQQPWGIRIVAEPAQRLGPIISADRPWEAMGIAISTLLYDEGKFRLWGWCQDKRGQKYGCYFESPDGKTWIRPNLGLVAFNGSSDNNLLALMFRDKAVCKDPSAPADERYKTAWHGGCDLKRWPDYKKRRPWSVMATELDPGVVHSILGAVSPDGIHWQELPDPISVEASDTQIVLYYDERLEKYVMYTRNYMIGPRAEGQPRPRPKWNEVLARRAIGRSESANFREFPLSEVMIAPGSDLLPTDSYYTNCRTSIPEAPDHHLLFPSVYHQDRDTTSIEIWASWDGKLWDRLAGSPILTTRTFGQWEGGCVFTQPELTELPDGSWVLPYTGYNYPHKYPRGAWKYAPGYAVWPKGRLIALEAPIRGEFATAVVLAEGEKLRINAVTERAGHILIEAAGLDGKPMEGRSFDDAVPIIGDHYWTPVTWKERGDLGLKKGEPIMLRVRMDKARIYGFEFE